MSWEKISNALSILDLTKLLIASVITMAGGVVLFFRAFSVNRRIAKNLGRPIFIFCPQGGKRANGQNIDMKREIGVLRNAGYFNIPSEVCDDAHSIEPSEIEKAGVVIMGYHPAMTNFDEIVRLAKLHNKPLIVYTFELGVRLKDEHHQVLQDYKWYTLSSMPLRLVSDVFAIMASFNHDK